MRKPGLWYLSGITCCCLLFVQPAVGEIPQHDRVRVLSAPRAITDFELTDRKGHTFRLADLNDSTAMIFFGFTHCPDVCPMTMQKLKQFVQEGGSALDDVEVVMISVDGERDSASRMDSFLGRYAESFIGLTGDPVVVKTIAKEFSAAFFKEASGDGDRSYSVAHSPQVFLLDGSGRLRAEFYDSSVDAMVAVALAVHNESISE